MPLEPLTAKLPMKIQKSVIIVNYKSKARARKLTLESIDEKEDQKKDLEVIVVNNDSQPLQLEKFFFSLSLD